MIVTRRSMISASSCATVGAGIDLYWDCCRGDRANALTARARRPTIGNDADIDTAVMAADQRRGDAGTRGEHIGVEKTSSRAASMAPMASPGHAHSDDVGRAFRLVSATCSDLTRPAIPMDVGRGDGSPASRM
jgi:hypothetical protein